jgi:hypothetical protein
MSACKVCIGPMRGNEGYQGDEAARLISSSFLPEDHKQHYADIVRANSESLQTY